MSANRNNAELYLSPSNKVKRVNKVGGYYLYEGKCRPGTHLDTDATWSIKRIEFTDLGDEEYEIEEKFVNGSRAQIFIFSNAASYEYEYLKS